MKAVWSTVLTFFALGLSVSSALAAEKEFNLTDQYEVRSIPDSDSTNVLYQFQYTKPTAQQHPDLSSRIEVYEAGHEGKLNLSQNSHLSIRENLSLNGGRKPSESLASDGNALQIESTWINKLTSIIKNNLAIPTIHLLSKIGNIASSTGLTVITAIKSSFTSSQSLFSSHIYPAVISLSTLINTTIDTFTNILASVRSSISEHIPRKLKIAATLLTLITPMLIGLAAKTSLGKQLFFIGQALLSVLDLALHGVSAGAALIQSLLTSFTFNQANKLNKKWIKQTFGRDIGEVGHDLLYGGGVIIIALSIFYAPAIGTKAGQLSAKIAPTLQRLSAPAAAYASTQGPKIVEETSRECQIPGQCDTKVDFAITLGVNTIAQGLPVEGSAVTIKKSLTAGNEVIEEGTSISKALKQTNDVILTFTRSDLEKRVGKDFVNEVFGNAQGKRFEQIAKKWPTALERLDENSGHTLAKHYKKDIDFLKYRLKNENLSFVSSYDSAESLLTSIENSFNSTANKKQIEDWLNSPSKTNLNLYYDSGSKIGYILEKGKNNIIDSHRAIIILKKTEKNSYYVLTSYVE